MFEARRCSGPRRVAFALVLTVTVFGTALIAQQKNPFLKYTEANFAENMQAAGRNYPVVKSLLEKGDFEAAKAQLTRVREHLAITVTYWRDRKNDAAIALLRTALNRTDDLDVALSAEKIDPAAVRDVTARIDAACQACHTVYREPDPVKKGAFRIKR